jgi:release factor glutamine methyltransferase
VRIVTPPGVFAPISDTRMLADALRAQTLTSHACVLDLCTGSGALAVCAALRGVGDVTAVDVSRRSVLAARLNARLNGVRVRAVRGDLFAAVGHRRFDAIVANPPYVPAEAGVDDDRPARGLRRAWEGGRDGRAVLDRICAGAPDHLRPGGFVLLVQSSVNGLQETVDRLSAGGLEVDVVDRRQGPLGPLLGARAGALEERGLLPRGQRHEELLVIRGRRRCAPACRLTAGRTSPSA